MQMSTKFYMGGRGVQKVKKLVYVVYGWRHRFFMTPLALIKICYFLEILFPLSGTVKIFKEKFSFFF